ncbi:MAG TPA: DUF2827 family protein [Caulobacteraceae bacterium]|nr:DUF2827 family protein [Caulobacteraceae bacterium]
MSIAHAQDVPSVLWSNGIAQNIVHLGLMLKQMDGIEPFLVAYPWDKMPIHPIGASFDIPTVNTAEKANELDIIIELGIRLEPDFTNAYPGKRVSYMAGNGLVMNFESSFLPVAIGGELKIEDGQAKLVNQKPGGAERGGVIGDKRFDAVWITPQHWHTNRGYVNAMIGPAFKAPHIWSPMALEHAKQSLGVDPVWKGRPETWSLATFDPNINVVKSFHLPLMAAAEAYKHVPDQIRRMMLFGANHLCGRAHFESMVNHVALPTSKISAEGRHMIGGMLGREVDLVITHQWENNLNYLYWDVLWLGYPLVHNSPEIAEAGYFYADFDPVSGGEAVQRAIREHDGPSEADKQAVWRFHIGNPANQQKYRELIHSVLDGQKIGD